MYLRKGIALAIIPVAAATGFVGANDIQPFKTVFNTDYVTAGVGGFRNWGTGTITLAGISGPVSEAYLYWSGPTNSEDPEINAQVSVNGEQVVGVNIGFSSDNCWGFLNSQAYRADVTALVAAQGNGDYLLEGFVKGTFGFPGSANANGASLIVFFDDGDPNNNRDVVLFDGNDSNIPNPYDADGWNVTLAGINYSGGQAFIQLHVADGQVFDDDELILNGLTLEPAGPIFQGDTVPSDPNGPNGGTGPTGNGHLWDIRSWDVTAWLNPGNNTLELITGTGGTDCLSLHLANVDLPAGAAPPPPGEGDEGCSPGYWRNHLGSWAATGYSPGDLVGDTFGPSLFEDSTLEEAIRFGGGNGVRGAQMILLRAAVAALLNAAHPDVDYAMTEGDVIDEVNFALASGSRAVMLALADALDALNNLGCPLD